MAADKARENPTSILGVAVRDLSRFQKVWTVVAKHGFGELLARSPLRPRFLFWSRKRLRPDAEMQRVPAPIRFRRLLEALGPTYVKLGQVMSTRPDRLPPDYIEALQQLQDRAPVVPFEEIKQVVEEGLGRPVEDLFAELDPTPLASASIAQTHRARTIDGREVVVKVQRPGIERTMRGDLDLLYLGARILEATIEEAELYGPSDVVVEFEKAIVREVDFTHELANLLMARRLLDPDRRVRVPEPLPELSSPTVLTTEYFDGRSIRTVEPFTDEARHVVTELVHTACKQVFVDGFFHADPHAGNLLVDDDGLVCMLDFGLVGRLSRPQREDLVTLLVATATNDVDTITRVLLRMGTPMERVNVADLKAEVVRVRAEQMPTTRLEDLDSAAFLQEFMFAAQRFHIRLATEYSLMVKAIVALEGMIKHLYPAVDFMAIARQYAEPLVRERFTPQKLVEEALGGVTGIGSMVRHLPAQLDQILHDLETGNFQSRPLVPSLEPLVPQLHQNGSRLCLALLASSLTLGTAILVPNDPTTVYHVPVLTVLTALTALGAWAVLWFWHFIGMGRPIRISGWVKLFRR